MPKKILIIEDEREIAELIRDIFAQENIDVVWADDGRKGIEKAKEVKPDLIILDLVLHDLHGVNVCKTLKANEDLRNVPVVIYTGHTTPGVADDVMKAGGDLYVSKTMPPTKIVKIVKEMLEKNGE